MSPGPGPDWFSALSSEIIPTHTPELFAAAVERAAKALTAGEAVALPTETVYGLAANALDPDAVARIFELKGRPAHNPIIVHVASLEMARACAAAWPAAAGALARAFWPGPLSVVVPRAGKIPPIVTAGGATVGLRWPSHPIMQAVIRRCGFPLAAPSANLSNRTSPTSAAHVAAALKGRVRLILDGGQCQVGIESTVVDVTCEPAHLLRPGMIHSESLRACLPGGVRAPSVIPAGLAARNTLLENSEPLRCPGQLESHYAPRARLLVLEWTDGDALAAALGALGVNPEDAHLMVYSRVPARWDPARVAVVPHDPEAYARALYAEWHRCDAAGARTIVVEALPPGPEWDGVRDRVRRAAASEPV